MTSIEEQLRKAQTEHERSACVSGRPEDRGLSRFIARGAGVTNRQTDGAIRDG